ncbi:putative PurR-regulated permease PerM [Parabacteroides sp. PF5-5]|uniref:AI-2E family transporter n=1 Tax=unclassified Parabacteroides TaxID=2649774 RepID=UPI002476BE5D|nr:MULTISPECIES: AI-2E family transporter [unclassified Parabacteroides]MDH6306765.1 putative PurR-regulated permease PerM [Parabacteroides sp. PH5-39]MDH6317651.1 putative PurR-regulated permease PerM [Parabacteroides sp. PF5-13]MDH6321477.1 putative PurR-regulated permease PerM [Parabacteroides sp. PH5-13]MDH6325246.1 putative PurR-regulated permease PerM [Parabacteroides sp. PH5-8]MDH6328836.1 putative PurR-regulated permease PerM [Parabacteroides sp. PH5-41]
MNSLFEKPFTFDRVARIVFGVVGVVLLLYILTILRNALLPFLIALLLAYMTQPLVKFFQYKLKFKNRMLSIVAVILTLLLALTLLLITVIPSVTQEVDRTLELLRTQRPDKEYIPFIPESWILFLQENISIEQITELLSKENFQNAIRQIAPKMWNLLSSTFSVLFSITVVFIIFLYFIFILLDYEKIANGWITLIPQKYRPFVSGVAEDVEQSMNRYFRGQALVALCVGILFAIGFKIVSFPLGITLGLFMGALNLVPYLQTLGLLPMVLLALLKSAETGQNFWIILALGVAVLLVVQVIQDMFLVPRIMGRAMGLNPAIILLSLSVWGTLLGFIGLIVALPLTTLCLSYYKRFILMEEEQQAIITEKPPVDTQKEAEK